MSIYKLIFSLLVGFSTCTLYCTLTCSVYTHNCCLSVAMTTDSVHLVDYEYAGPNFIVFDIANHFCEYAGM